MIASACSAPAPRRWECGCEQQTHREIPPPHSITASASAPAPTLLRVRGACGGGRHASQAVEMVAGHLFIGHTDAATGMVLHLAAQARTDATHDRPLA